MPRWPLSKLERFEQTVNKTDSCWLWTGCKKECSGMIYGNIYMDGKNWFAHRASYTLYKGQIPQGLQINHKCDTPLCVNPEHLYLGTQQDNMKDMKDRDRRKGKGCFDKENNSNSKLTQKLADEIKEVYNSGMFSQEYIAEWFGISQSAVSHIIIGKRWS